MGGAKVEEGGRSKRVPIEEAEIYRLFEECADCVWTQVETWDWKAVKTVGIQLITAVDSINANLVEGDGRFTSADSGHFFIIARGSARETRLWLRRAVSRKLVDRGEGEMRIRQIEDGARQLNGLITFRRKKRAKLLVRESAER